MYVQGGQKTVCMLRDPHCGVDGLAMKQLHKKLGGYQFGPENYTKTWVVINSVLKTTQKPSRKSMESNGVLGIKHILIFYKTIAFH